eukprot:CAMPEP_0182445684 /NCGR_PEP_ID=MMETSP1172-20130603/3728_1 /TAXON_ID=708627 /ORGANISM="Timspurckia oligopyrenoides, Strain CCMP3278" /LENGTH=316 /DNA_ID=CAMNT_0024641497 /DNA_START=363 /DNA_END=1313 /DNA_ORIENTATION=+
MEDIPGYMTSAIATLGGKNLGSSTFHEGVIETDVDKIGKEGELVGCFSIHAGYAGASAAKIAKAKFRGSLWSTKQFHSSSKKTVCEGIKSAMLYTQGKVYDYWIETNQKHGVHSCVVILKDGYVFCGNAGEAGAVLCRADGDVGLLSVPNKRLDETQEPAVTSYGLDWEDEFVLIACNAFWKKMDANRAVKLARESLKKNKSADVAVQKLVYAAHMSGAKNTVTVMLILLNPASAFGASDGGESSLRSVVGLRSPKTELSIPSTPQRSISNALNSSDNWSDTSSQVSTQSTQSKRRTKPALFSGMMMSSSSRSWQG